MRTYKSALIIDDDVDLCMTLKSVLGATIAEVKTAHTLADGMTALTVQMPEVVFLDNNLPDGRGVDYVKQIKAQSPATLIIFMTAVENAKQTAVELGVDVFLEKPLTFSAINNALTSLERAQQQL